MMENRFAYVNESLIDDVEIDEVQDDEKYDSYNSASGREFVIDVILIDAKWEGKYERFCKKVDIFSKKMNNFSSISACKYVCVEETMLSRIVSFCFKTVDESDESIDMFSFVVLWLYKAVDGFKQCIIREHTIWETQKFSLNVDNKDSYIKFLDLDMFISLFQKNDIYRIVESCSKSLLLNGLPIEKLSDNVYKFYVENKDDEEKPKGYVVDNRGRLVRNTEFNYDFVVTGNCGFVIVGDFFDRQNYMDVLTGNYLLNEWVDMCYEFTDDGYGRIAKIFDDKNYVSTFVDTKGKRVFGVWFESCSDVVDGACVVTANGLCKIIDINGKQIGDVYKNAYPFNEGYARVCLDKNKWNFIDRDGKKLSEEDFAYCNDFHNGCAIVRFSGKSPNMYNYITTEGRILSDDRFSIIKMFGDGYGVVGYRDELGKEKYNYIGLDGKLLYKKDDWFKKADEFSKGFGHVVNESDKHNFLKSDGSFITDDWFDVEENEILNMSKYGMCIIKKIIKKENTIDIEKENVINSKGEEVLPFDSYQVYWLGDGYFFAEYDKDKIIFSPDGKPICGDNFDICVDMSCGFVRVMKNGKWNFVKTDGSYLFDEWLDDKPGYFKAGIAKISDDCYVDVNGEITSFL